MFDISWNNCQKDIFSNCNDKLKSTHNHNTRTFRGRDTVCKPYSKSALLSILVFPVYMCFSSLRLYIITYFSLFSLFSFWVSVFFLIIIILFPYIIDLPSDRFTVSCMEQWSCIFPLRLHKRAKSCHRMTSRWTKGIICHAATHKYPVTMAPNSIYIIQLKHEGFARQKHV